MPGRPRGPIPERSGDRRRRNTDGGTITKAPAGAEWAAPELPEHWHAICHLYYDAILESGQSRFYEPSDWAALYDVLDDLNLYKRGGVPVAVSEESAKKATDRGELVIEKDGEHFVIPKRGRSSQMRLAIDQALSRLMVTEGDRRRLRLELEREGDTEEGVVVDMSAYRNAL